MKENLCNHVEGGGRYPVLLLGRMVGLLVCGRKVVPPPKNCEISDMYEFLREVFSSLGFGGRMFPQLCR